MNLSNSASMVLSERIYDPLHGSFAANLRARLTEPVYDTARAAIADHCDLHTNMLLQQTKVL
jgi:hypothetical protein